MIHDIVSSRHPHLPQALKDFINRLLWEIPKAEENDIDSADTWSQMYGRAVMDALESDNSNILWVDLPAWMGSHLTKGRVSGPDGEINSLLVGFYRFGDTAPEHSFGDSWPLIWLYWDGTDFITFYEGADVGDEHKESDVWLEGEYDESHRNFIKKKEDKVVGWFSRMELGLGITTETLQKNKVAIVATIDDERVWIKNPILNWLYTSLESLYD